MRKLWPAHRKRPCCGWRLCGACTAAEVEPLQSFVESCRLCAGISCEAAAFAAACLRRRKAISDRIIEESISNTAAAVVP